jgi:hypothetical protein
MASAAVYDAIKAHIQSNYTGSAVTFENEDFTPPKTSGVAEPWCMVEITGTMYGQQSIGEDDQADNRWDEEGTLWLHFFARTGTGSHDLRIAMMQMVNLFRGTTLLDGNLEFLDASVGLGEPGDDDGVYWRVTVTIDWRYWDA